MFLYGYLENSYVVNLGQASRDNTNDIRFYDHDVGYTWNALELSFKKDPSERYPWKVNPNRVDDERDVNASAPSLTFRSQSVHSVSAPHRYRST